MNIYFTKHDRQFEPADLLCEKLNFAQLCSPDGGTTCLPITLQRVSAYSVVRAICRVNAERRFLAIWGSENTELIFLKFGKNDYVNHATPRAKNGGRPKGAWPGGIGEVVRSRVFFIYCSFNPPTAYHEKRGLTLDAPRNVLW